MKDNVKTRLCRSNPLHVDQAANTDMVKFLPQEIVESILFPLPVRRLHELRLVSRSWNALINSQNFRRRYCLAARQSSWLGVSGINAAYHVASGTWCSLAKDVFGINLGRWKIIDIDDEEEEADVDDTEKDDTEKVDVMNLFWTKDGALSCCMDCPDTDDRYYSDGSVRPPIRLVLFDGSTGSSKQITDFEDEVCWPPVGVGIQAHSNEKDYILVVAMRDCIDGVPDNGVSVSTFDSSTKARNWGTCDFKDVKEVRTSNFLLNNCFYFLLVHENGLGISILYYRVPTKSWHHWDTSLEPNFFSRVSVESNLLRCERRILAVGGMWRKGLVVVKLKKPLEDEILEVKKNKYGQLTFIPTKNHQHPSGTWEEIARMPKRMWTQLKSYSKSFRVVGNDYFIYVLPKSGLRPGQKGVIYDIWSYTWQWMTSFPSRCEVREDFSWGQLLGVSSIMVHEAPMYSWEFRRRFMAHCLGDSDTLSDGDY